MPTPNIAVFVRTNSFTPQVAQLATSLEAGFETAVTMICDERSGEIDCDPFQKSSLMQSRIEVWGIGSTPNAWGWLCGDFCYYAARELSPDADWYVLVESDVFVTEKSARMLAHHIQELKADAAACEFGEFDAPKRFSRGLSKHGITSKCGCIFALTCVRPHIVDAMKDLRIRVQQDPSSLVNDEAILAGAVISGGYSFVDLFESLPAHFSKDTFYTNPPHLLEAMPLSNSPDAIVHPTISLGDIMEGIVPDDMQIGASDRRINTGKRLFSRGRLRKVLREAPRKTRRKIKAALAAKSTQ
jgi:hypothetical protein